MDRSEVKWGVIGCARIAQRRFLPAMKSATRSRLYAVAGRTKQKLAEFETEFHPEKIYDDYGKLLDDPQIDTVYIPLPNSLHKEWVIKAAERGMHILCEKPLGLSAVEAAAMKEAAERNGVLLIEGFDFRYNPAIFQFKGLLPAIGRLNSIEGFYSISFESREDVRMDKSLGGGAMYDIGCYMVNLYRFLTDKSPQKVKASATLDKKTGVDTNVSCIFSYEDDIIASFTCSVFSFYSNGFKATGEKGIIEYSGAFHANGKADIKLTTMNKSEVISIECPNTYGLEIQHFERCLLDGERPLITLQESVENAQTMDRIFREIGY